jgi:hypothetical protein
MSRDANYMNSEELAAACRRRAEAVVQAAAEGVFGSPRSDPVGIQFDWEVPPHARAPIVFRIHISRGAAARVLKFAIDLGRLQTDDLQTLHDFLTRYHARVTFELAH